MDKTQKEKIRDDREERFRKDFRAGLFKNLLTGLENPFEIEKWWLNELDLAIKETEERIVREVEGFNIERYARNESNMPSVKNLKEDILALIRNK
jgi:hypothetical protein